MLSKKAGTLSIIMWVVGTIVIVLWLAGFAYFFNQVTVTMQQIPVVSSIVNISSAVNNVLVPVNQAMNSLTYISFILIIMLGFSMIIENYYIRRHPIMFVIHFFIVILAVVASIYIANAYGGLMQTGILAGYITSHKGASYLILNLPSVTAVLGVIGFIILLINFNRDTELRSDAI